MLPLAQLGTSLLIFHVPVFALGKAERQAAPKTPGSGHHLFPSNIWNIKRLERDWSRVGWTNLRREPPPAREEGRAAANVRSSSRARRCVTPVSCLHFSIDLWGSSFPDPPPSGGGTSTRCEESGPISLKAVAASFLGGEEGGGGGGGRRKLWRREIFLLPLDESGNELHSQRMGAFCLFF